MNSAAKDPFGDNHVYLSADCDGCEIAGPETITDRARYATAR